MDCIDQKPRIHISQMGQGQKLGSGEGFQASLFSYPHKGFSRLGHSWMMYESVSFLPQIPEVKLSQSIPKKPSMVCKISGHLCTLCSEGKEEADLHSLILDHSVLLP